MSTQRSREGEKPVDQLQAGIEAALNRAARKAQALEKQMRQRSSEQSQSAVENREKDDDRAE